MNFREEIRELKNKSLEDLSPWERKVREDLDKTERAFKALEGKRKSLA